MGLDTVELVMDVEDHFGILLLEEECQHIRVIGDLADTILAKIVAASVVPCPTMQTFFEVRRVLRKLLANPQLRIRPSTLLRELFPKSNRRNDWKQLQREALFWRLPNLQLNPFVSKLMLAIYPAVFVVPFLLFPSDAWILSFSTSVLGSILLYAWMNRYRTEIPEAFSNVGDLLRSAMGGKFATKKAELSTKELVLAELYPIVAEQFGVELKKLRPETRFIEDLGAD